MSKEEAAAPVKIQMQSSWRQNEEDGNSKDMWGWMGANAGQSNTNHVDI